MKLLKILLCLVSWTALSLAQTRIPSLPAITGAAVDPAADLLWLNDTSAGTAGSKKITLAELVNVSSFTNGNFLAANSVEFSQVNGLTNPVVVRSAAEMLSPPVVGHEEAIVHFMDQLIDFQTADYPADGKYLVVGGGGDSMGTSSGFAPFVSMELVRRFGLGAVATDVLQGANSFGAGQFSTTLTLAGSAAKVSDNFQYLPNGDYYSIPASGTITETPASANMHAGFRRVRCWYGRRTGGGTLTFTVAQNGVSLTPVVVDTSTGTAGTIGYVDFDLAGGLVPNGKPVLTVASAGATSHYLGSYMYLNNGFVPVAVGKGGTSYAQALSGTAANLATFCSVMDMRLCFHAVKEEDATWSDMATMMDRWASQHPRCSHIWVGATPSPTGYTSSDPLSNAAMRTKALELKMCFVDGQRLLRSPTYLESIGSVPTYGWNEPVLNGPHLSQPANRFIASYIIDKVLLGFDIAGRRFPKNLVAIEAMGSPMDLAPTRMNAQIWAQSLLTIGTTNFTQTTPDLGRLTVVVPNETPVANTGRGEVFLGVGPQMNNRQIYSYRISDGQLLNNIHAVIMVGGANRNECATGMTNTNFNGFRVIHGVEPMGAGSDLVPWIRFAVKGSGTSETLSPKIYHSSATGPVPYAGGTWRVSGDSMYWIEYIGAGTNTAKRFRAWHQPTSNGSSETRMPSRRLIADWTGVITVGGSSAATTYFAVVSSDAPTATGSARSISLQNFSVDYAPRANTDLGSPDMNY